MIEKGERTPSEHFNSQPHKEADIKDGNGYSNIGISTHSLTRRLTNLTILNPSTYLFQLTASQGG